MALSSSSHVAVGTYGRLGLQLTSAVQWVVEKLVALFTTETSMSALPSRVWFVKQSNPVLRSLPLRPRFPYQ